MLVQAESIFVTASPLAELVWLPKKGLGLKCTDSSSAENRTSLWWNTDSFDVITTGTESPGIGHYIDNGMLSKMNAHVNSPRKSIVEIAADCPIMNHEQTSENRAVETSPEEIERSPKRTEAFVTVANGEKSRPHEERKFRGSSPGNRGRIVGSEINSTGKLFSQGHDDAQVYDSLSSNPNEMGIDGVDSNIGDLPEFEVDREKEDSHALKPVEDLCLRLNMSAKPASSLQSMQHKNPGKDLDAIEGDGRHNVQPQLTYFYPPGKKMLHVLNISQHKDPCPLKSFDGCRVETVNKGIVGPVVAIQNEIQNKPLLNKTAERTFDVEEDISKGRNGKQIIHEFGEGSNVDGKKNRSQDSKETDCSHGSEKRNDSNDSIKSSNRVTGKRLWCFGSKEFLSKKLKHLNEETSFDGNLARPDSSFINWISGFTKPLTSSVHAETPMAMVPKNSCSEPKHLHLQSSFDRGINIPGNSIGFESLLQTLHYPKMVMQQIISGNVNEFQKNMHTKVRGPNKQSVSASGMLHISKKLNLLQKVPLATLVFDHSQPEVLSQDGIEFASPSQAQGKQHHVGLDDHVICNLGSSSSSIQITCTSPGNFNTLKVDSDVHSPNVIVVSGEHEILRSFWIKRLCKKSPSLPISCQTSKKWTCAMQMQFEGGNLCLPHLQNENIPFRGKMCPGNVGMSLIRDPMDAMGNEDLNLNISDSSSKGMPVDKRLEAKLNPILPSKRTKKVEPVTSVFVKRLDAFKHIKSSNIVNDVLCSTSTCLFCGQTGHTMKDCSRIIGTELEIFQKNINSYNGPKDSACLCVLCFQLNHWAIECPQSFRKALPAGAYVTEVNYGRTDEKLNTENCRKNERIIRECQKSTSVHDMELEEVKQSHPKLLKDFPVESNFKGKDILMFSLPRVTRENQMTGVCSSVKRKAFNEQTKFFEGIRGLHLTRTELIRLMKAPISDVTLEGFFLRVRLGKPEEKLARSGYQVACISGGSEGNSFGIAKHHIPVNIGGFKCLVDCRFVSNNDFLEDELNAWWEKTSRSNSKLPTEEQLMRKLQEKKKLAFDPSRHPVSSKIKLKSQKPSAE